MNRGIVMMGSISSWITAGVYEGLMTTGVELTVLKWIAVMTMAAGLYFGLRQNDKNKKGEA